MSFLLKEKQSMNPQEVQRCSSPYIQNAGQAPQATGASWAACLARLWLSNLKAINSLFLPKICVVENAQAYIQVYTM